MADGQKVRAPLPHQAKQATACTPLACGAAQPVHLQPGQPVTHSLDGVMERGSLLAALGGMLEVVREPDVPWDVALLLNTDAMSCLELVIAASPEQCNELLGCAACLPVASAAERRRRQLATNGSAHAPAALACCAPSRADIHLASQ